MGEPAPLVGEAFASAPPDGHLRRARQRPGGTVDHLVSAGRLDEVEAELVALTRRLSSLQTTARDAACALAEGLAGLAAGSVSGEQALDRSPGGLQLVALARLATSLQADLDRCTELVGAMPRRLLPLLRHEEAGDRCRHARTPIARPAGLLLGGQWRACLTLDLSEGGVLVRPLEPGAEPQDPTGLAELQLEGVGRLPVVLVGRSPLGLHLAFRTCAPAVRAALARLLEEARRGERALLGLARRIVDDLSSWRVDPNGRLVFGLGAGPGAERAEEDARHALQVFELHLRRESRLVAASLFAADGRELAARAWEEGVPWEPPPEPPGRGPIRCRVVPPCGSGSIEPAWMKVEADIGDAGRTFGTPRLQARASAASGLGSRRSGATGWRCVRSGDGGDPRRVVERRPGARRGRCRKIDATRCRGRQRRHGRGRPPPSPAPGPPASAPRASAVPIGGGSPHCARHAR